MDVGNEARFLPYSQAATHLTEETERSDWTAPVSIVTAVFTASIAGLIYILVLTFCIQVNSQLYARCFLQLLEKTLLFLLTSFVFCSRI